MMAANGIKPGRKASPSGPFDQGAHGHARWPAGLSAVSAAVPCLPRPRYSHVVVYRPLAESWPRAGPLLQHRLVASMKRPHRRGGRHFDQFNSGAACREAGLQFCYEGCGLRPRDQALFGGSAGRRILQTLSADRPRRSQAEPPRRPAWSACSACSACSARARAAGQEGRKGCPQEAGNSVQHVARPGQQAQARPGQAQAAQQLGFRRDAGDHHDDHGSANLATAGASLPPCVCRTELAGKDRRTAPRRPGPRGPPRGTVYWVLLLLTIGKGTL